MTLPSALGALLVLAIALSGCSERDRNELTVTVSNPDLVDSHAAVEVWLRIESIRGDMKHNGPVTVASKGTEEFSMGDLQGPLRFTAIVGNHSHTEDEQVEPDEDWVVEVRSNGSTCFRFGIDGTGPMRCG